MSANSGGKFLNAEVLARLMGQPVLSRFAMEGSVSGQHKSPHRGSSVEFAEYRNYTPGDDVRRLDWRVLGRTDKYFMKEFEAETNLRCYFVLDCSASMSFVGKNEPRFDFARRLIATLAYLIIHQGDAASLVCVGEKTISELPPRRNPAHLQNILTILENVKSSGETGLIPALHELAEKVRRRALVIVISDFFCDPTELMSCFQHLRFQKHDLALFHLLDRAELDFNFDRPVRFVDMENNFNLVTEPAVIRDRYLQQFHGFLDAMQHGCREFNADYRRVITDENYEKVLADFLIERARLSSAA